jgi:hypothetical protein
VGGVWNIELIVINKEKTAISQRFRLPRFCRSPNFWANLNDYWTRLHWCEPTQYWEYCAIYLCNPDHRQTFEDTMLITFPRVKQAFVRTVSFLYAYRRLLFIIFFILPFISYLFAWILCTTETFFPRPLREATEVLIVVAHPDDECAPPVS